MLILKVKYAIPLGIFIGLFNLIPYFGAIIAIVVSAIIILLTGGLAQCLIAITVVTIMQQVDANFINPKIVSMNIDVSPVVVMLGVTIGGAYFGTIGMFLGVPFIAIIKIIFEDIIANKLQKNRILDIIHPKNRLNFNKNNNLGNIKYTYNSNKNLKYHLEKIKERLEKINKNKENKIILDIVNNNRQYKIMKKNIKKPNKINKRND